MREYVLTERELRRLLEASIRLDILIQNGVDNWTGYSYEFEEESDIDELVQEVLDEGIYRELINWR